MDGTDGEVLELSRLPVKQLILGAGRSLAAATL